MYEMYFPNQGFPLSRAHWVHSITRLNVYHLVCLWDILAACTLHIVYLQYVGYIGQFGSHTCMNTLIKQRLNWIQPRWIEVIIYNQTVCSGTMCLKFGPVGRRCLLCMTKNRPNMLHIKSTCKILKSNIHVHYTLIKYQPWFGPHWRNATCHPAIQPDSWFM